ncbi:MAG: NAD(P)-dependent alcohol dehydrogenase [Oscillospiraceae bacterium]|nr:NAD(P)-dependent alcohol dehydrogenase [Oscillospiraceae bacterium]
MQVKAAVAHVPGKMVIETVELAEPKATEVCVKIIAAGVCHTDAAGLNAVVPVTFPAIFGHEGVGIVESVGVGVDTLKPGDKVILSFASCGCCKYCIQGTPYACDELNRLFFDGSYKDGTKRFSKDGEAVSSFFGQGSFADHVVVDARNAVKVDIDEENLKKLCSLGCGVQTGAGAVLNTLVPEPESTLAVFGCGGVGMAAIMAAKIRGCSKIIAVDVVPSRLEMALECGATHVVNGKECDSVEKIKEITGGGANYSVECTGVPFLVKQALSCLSRLGKCCLVSVTGDAEVPIALEPQLMNPSVTLVGVTEGGANPQTFIPKLVQFYKEGRLPVDKLTDTYKFDDIEQAFEDSHSGKTIKPILIMD